MLTHEVFALYRECGFLHPGRLPGIDPAEIETTWERLLAADPSVFRFVAGRDADGALRSSVCAFMYAPSTCHAQHLVSADRNTDASSLTVLAELGRWAHDAGVDARLTFRPENRGAGRLFGGAVERLPHEVSDLSLVDYATTPRGALTFADDRNPAVHVTRATAGEAIGFYRRLLHPVELTSLGLEDPQLATLGRRYRHAGLLRARTVLIARLPGRIAGACIVNHGSPGINFAGFENAIEHLRVAEDLSGSLRRAVWMALARAAVVNTRRDWIVAALHPDDRDLAVEAGLVPPEPTQYAILTVSHRGGGCRGLVDWFAEYYAERVRAAA